MAKLPEPRPPCIVELRGQEIDIATCLPMKMGYWNHLRAQGVDPMRMAKAAKTGDIESGPIQLIAYQAVIRVAALKGIMGVTDAELDDLLTLSDCTRIATAVMKADSAGEVDRPTSTASSPLPNGGDGVQPTLMSSASPT